MFCTKFSHKYDKRCLDGRSTVHSLAGAFIWCPAFADEGLDGIVEEATVAVSLLNTLSHRYSGFVIFNFTFLKASVNIYVILKSVVPSIPNLVIQKRLTFYSHLLQTKLQLMSFRVHFTNYLKQEFCTWFIVYEVFIRTFQYIFF